ncbi:hypothetical protein ACLOJK_022938 [Asimina triloba]
MLCGTPAEHRYSAPPSPAAYEAAQRGPIGGSDPHKIMPSTSPFSSGMSLLSMIMPSPPRQSTMPSSPSLVNPSRRTAIAQIRAAYHLHNVDLISDPSIPQADADHSSHPWQARLCRRRRTHLHPALVVAYFRSNPKHLSIAIFMAHLKGLDPTVDHHRDDIDRFLLSLISPSISPAPNCFVSVVGKAWIGRSRPSIACAACHYIASTQQKPDATASAARHCPLPLPLLPATTPSAINGVDR